MRWLACLFGFHNWTCKAQEGIPPKSKIIKRDAQTILLEFYEYSKMYCKHCGKESDLNA